MPIYEYQCTSCEASFEIMQKIADGPPAKCPFCGHNEVRKLISKVGFQLKGTGWYETDFKDKKSSKKPDKTNTQKSDNSASKNKAKTSGGQKSATSGEAK